MRVLQKDPAAQGAADFTDYDVAYPLLAPLVVRQLNRVTDTDEDTLAHIQAMGREVFTSSNVGEALGISDRHARRRLESLLRCGLIAETEHSRGNRYEYKLTGQQVPQARCGLTTPDALREAVEERSGADREGN
jgi:predicted ArsR family transcriptional regulator